MVHVTLNLRREWLYGKNENKIVDVIATSDMHSHFLNGDYGSNIYRAGTYVNEARKIIRKCHITR